MKRARFLASLIVIFFAGPGLRAQTPVGAVGDTPDMAEGRKMGVTVVQLMNDNLRERKAEEYPGIAAWLAGPGKIYSELNREHPTNDWRRLDAEKLVTGNGVFWQMYYEIAPADVGLFMLHAGALLAAGDANRCDNVLRLIFHSGKVDESTKRYLIAIFQHSNMLKEASNGMVHAGIKLHDAEKYDEAIAQYTKAIELWPQNGWAHYEVGYSLRAKSGNVAEPEKDVVEAFARARRFQPFQMAAWQGSKEDVPGLEAMYRSVMPVWQKSLESLDYVMTDEELEAFGEGLQEAGVDDLALVSRQVLIARRGRYLPADHPFISTSLRRLAPGKETEVVIKKLGGESFMAARIYVPTEGQGEQEKKKEQ